MKKAKSILSVVTIIFLLQNALSAQQSGLILQNSNILSEISFINPQTGWIDGSSSVHVTPYQNAINVNKSSDITAAFNQDMNASTINRSNIKVFGLQTGLKSSSVSYNAGTRTATINPNSDFKVGEKIQVTLSSGIQSSSNTPITPYTWTFTVQALSGTAVFTETSIIDTSILGGGLNRIVSGDFDSDGDLDLAVSGTNIIIYKNNGNSEFSYSQTISGFGGNILIGDFDGDVDLDIVSNSGSLNLLKNNGNGIFAFASFSPGGGELGDAGDLDEDGDLDIAFYGGNQIRWYLNDGNGNFSEREITFDDLSGLPAFVLNLSLGDMDNDGDLDFTAVVIQIHTPQYNDLLTLYNDGNANFGNAARLSTYFTSAMNADLDGDRDLDILSNANLFFNNGNGIFTSAAFSSGTNSNILPADYDADGDIDAAFTNESSNNVKVFKNNSAGSLNFFSNSTSGTNPIHGTSGDFDGDGDIDLAVINNLGHTGSNNDISILLNNYTSTTCSISGEELILPGSINNIYVGSSTNGYWDISNYDNTQASIPPNSNGDTARVSAGANTGHFVLYFIIPDGNGGYPFCSKHVYIDFQTTPKIVSLDPLQNAVSVLKSSDINITFENNMNASTINNSNVKVYGSLTGLMNCTVTYVALEKKININPVNDFKPGEEITVILNSAIKGSTGNSIKAFQYKFIAAATGGEATFTEIQTGFFANKFAVGDIDGDGDLDLLTNNDLSLWINKNNGQVHSYIIHLLVTAFQIRDLC